MIVRDHDFDGHGNPGFPRRSAAIEGETKRSYRHRIQRNKAVVCGKRGRSSIIPI
jgi:hypothetical protein